MNSFYCSSPICDGIKNSLIDNDEDLLKDKKEIAHTILNIDIRADWYNNIVNIN